MKTTITAGLAASLIAGVAFAGPSTDQVRKINAMWDEAREKPSAKYDLGMAMDVLFGDEENTAAEDVTAPTAGRTLPEAVTAPAFAPARQ